MQNTKKRWPIRLLSVCLTVCLFAAMAVTASAAGPVPSGEALPTVSSPAAGVLRIEGEDPDVYVRVHRGGEVMCEWMPIGDEGFIELSPVSGGTYSVEACYEEALTEDVYHDAEEAVIAKWEGGALEGEVAEPAAASGGNTIDLSAAKEGLVFSPDVLIYANNSLRIMQALLSDSVSAAEMERQPLICRYYTFHESTETGAPVWYRLDASMPVTLTASKPTETITELEYDCEKMELILDGLETSGYLHFNGTELAVIVKGSNSVGGIYCGDGDETLSITGDPSDGADTLSVKGGGISTDGRTLAIGSLSGLDIHAAEENGLYISGNEDKIIVTDISGDVSIVTDCYANSAVTAYSSSVSFKNIDGDLTISAKGGYGIQADYGISISSVTGDVSIVSEEDCALVAVGDVRIDSVASLYMQAGGDAEEALLDPQLSAMQTEGNIDLRNIDHIQFKSEVNGINASAIYSYEEEEPEYIYGGSITIADIGVIEVDALSGISADENLLMQAINRVTVTTDANALFAANKLTVEDVRQMQVSAIGEYGYGISCIQEGGTLKNIQELSIKATTYGIGGSSLELYNTRGTLDCGEGALIIIDEAVTVKADGAVTVKSGETEDTAKSVEVVGDSFSTDQIGKYLSIDAALPGYVMCEGNRSCPMWEFADLAGTAWYHDGIHYCLENGLMGGIGGGLFDPNGTTTRAMIVTILYRMDGSPASEQNNMFTDVQESAYYYDAVLWAYANGITGGYGNGLFGPNDAITREQMVTMLLSYATYKDLDVSAGEETNILSYEDAFDVAEYATPAMQWACGTGIVGGIERNGVMYLDPWGSATRAQAATMLMRLGQQIS